MPSDPIGAWRRTTSRHDTLIYSRDGSTAWQLVAPTPCQSSACSVSLRRSAGGAAAILLPTGLWDGDAITNQLPHGGRAGSRSSQLWSIHGGISRNIFGTDTPFPAPFFVRTIWGASDDDVWAPVPMASSPAGTARAGRPSRAVCAGRSQRTNGKWQKLDAPTAWPLEAVWVAPDGATWVAGRYGEILVHR